ncbi:glycosyltransferase [Stakelama sp. CBK3Z-3]|uniref:Glycosyltransferase n=1 Tax=Stakelama flava TaxID=2860338 RepID=A0ABS6XPS6_9SPHN|nr:glycosyltransferase [Stakelama flava]MBW4332212.1 glycosyltransferase [Stakelama flava]
MTGPIGYYVHHHGDGHRQRALAIAESVGAGITLLGTGLAGRTGAVSAIDLPDDRVADVFSGADRCGDSCGERPPALHYAPFDHDGVRRRTAEITHWIAEARPGLMVVDVSVEVAMLARLASVPTVYVRLSGVRDDRPHVDAFASACALLAPFHAALEDPATPPEVVARTFYAPGIIRAAPVAEVDERCILVVLGSGGGDGDGARWAEAARAVPDHRWEVLGACNVPSDMPGNLRMHGWIDDADGAIARAGLVIGAAGDGLVSAVLARRKPFLCLPEARPFDEQRSKARRLAALEAAVVIWTWPPASDWPLLIARAFEQRRGGWPPALDTAEGAARVAAWLTTLLPQAASAQRARS